MSFKLPTIKITEPLIRWTGIPIVALIANEAVPHEPPLAFWIEWLISIGFTTIYWTGAVVIFHRFRKWYPEISKTGLRLLLTYISMVIWMATGGLPFKLILGFTSWDEMLTMSTHVNFLPFNMIAGFVIGTLYETTYFFQNWKETFKINQQLKSQQIKTQFEVLQNQMSPHFLFNSLNTLTTLIAENQEVAIDFTQKLSEVYRYILKTKERELVHIEEEIEFAKAYFFLLKMRYPDNLSLDFNIESTYHQRHIAPLTLQMLIENAIKHNVVSKTNPLHVDIYVENGSSIVVKNNLQPKKTLERSTKTGLQNIQKRYHLLGQKEIDIITTAKNFIVAIPLINLIDEKTMSAKPSLT